MKKMEKARHNLSNCIQLLIQVSFSDCNFPRLTYVDQILATDFRFFLGVSGDLHPKTGDCHNPERNTGEKPASYPGAFLKSVFYSKKMGGTRHEHLNSTWKLVTGTGIPHPFEVIK